MGLTFGNFVLQPVFGRIAPGEAAEVRDMWVGERVLDRQEASRRTSEVVFLIREKPSGVLAGACTVYPGPLGETGLTYWHFRMFLRAGFRGSPGLPGFVLLATHRYLEEHRNEIATPVGAQRCFVGGGKSGIPQIPPSHPRAFRQAKPAVDFFRHRQAGTGYLPLRLRASRVKRDKPRVTPARRGRQQW